MKENRFISIALAFTVASMATTALFAQQSTSLAGTAEDEAKTAVRDHTVRARYVKAGSLVLRVNMGAQGTSQLPD